jgi:hypothetical protein
MEKQHLHQPDDYDNVWDDWDQMLQVGRYSCLVQTIT